MNGTALHRSWRHVVCLSLAATALTALPVRAAGPGVSGRVFAIDDKGLITGIVPGAVIEFKNQGGKPAARVTADQNGYYQVELPPGTYGFKVTADGFKDEDAGRGITLKRSDGFAVHNFSLSRGKLDPKHKPPPPPSLQIGALRGRVFEKTPEGQLIGIPGAQIALRRNGQRLIEVITRGPHDKEPGAYEVVLPAGAYQASVAAAGFETLVDPSPIVIVAGATETRDFILQRVKPPKPADQGIKGRVTVFDPRRPAAPLPPVKLTIPSLTDPSAPVLTLSPGAAGEFAQAL